MLGLALAPPIALLAAVLGLRYVWLGHTVLGAVITGAATTVGGAATASLIRGARAHTTGAPSGPIVGRQDSRDWAG